MKAIKNLAKIIIYRGKHAIKQMFTIYFNYLLLRGKH